MIDSEVVRKIITSRIEMCNQKLETIFSYLDESVQDGKWINTITASAWMMEAENERKLALEQLAQLQFTENSESLDSRKGPAPSPMHMVQDPEHDGPHDPKVF